MIKQPTQPLKFFSSFLEVERDWEKRDKGNPGTHTITEDVVFLPPFQIKFDWRGGVIDDFFDHIFLFNYNTGSYSDITNDLRAWGVTNYSTFQNLIMYRFPLWTMADPGDYYLRISDGALGGADVTEVWYSEIFRLCDLNRNLLTSLTGSVGWNTFQITDYISTRDVCDIRVCESGGQSNTIDSDEFYVTKDEPLDFYVYGYATAIACGDNTFLPLQFSLVDSGGVVMSNVVDGVFGIRHFKLIPTKTTVATLIGENLGVDGKSGWIIYLYRVNPQLHNNVWAGGVTHEIEDIGKYKVLQWSNSCNICDMVYEEQAGNIEDIPFVMSYENHLILDDPPLIPECEIKENVAENDKGDKLQLLAAQQDWHYLQIGARENLAKAIYNIHLHDTVKIYHDGEEHVICENAAEISYSDDYNSTVKFRFREESCPVDACCFDICCPNIRNVIDVLANTGALPAASTSNCGYRYLVADGGVYYIYESDGTDWNQLPEENADGNCLYDESVTDIVNDTPYMYWNGSNWYRFGYILSATFNGATATVNLRDYSKPGLRCFVYWGTIANRSEEFTLTGEASESLTFDYTGGAATFHLYMYDEDGCVYGTDHSVLAEEE